MLNFEIIKKHLRYAKRLYMDEKSRVRKNIREEYKSEKRRKESQKEE